MSVNAESVKKLRQQTGAGFMNCKKALEESKGDFGRAIQWLKKKDLSHSAGKAHRIASEGVVASYIHGQGRVGVLVEVNSETDFAARNKEFQKFVKNLTLHIAAMNPLWVNETDIPEKIKSSEKNLFEEKAKTKAKNEETAKRISEGLYKKWLTEVCLSHQEFINPDAEAKESVLSALKKLISKLGENVIIRRFSRFSLGEGIEKKEEHFAKEVEKASKE